jgi:hypothetical protein
MILSCLIWALCALVFVFPGMLVEAQLNDYWWTYKVEWGSNTKYAEDLLDRIVGEEKKDTWIIQTDLDTVDQNRGWFENDLKISNTLDSTRFELSSYLEWLAFLWLSAAVALLVYNGLMLVMSPLAEDQLAQVKKRIVYIIAGTLLLTWFYFVMKILLSFLVEIISKS